MATIAERISVLQKQAEKAEADKSRIQGRMEQLNETLKRDFGLDSLEAAKEEFDRLEEQIEIATKGLKTTLDALEAAMPCNP